MEDDLIQSLAQEFLSQGKPQQSDTLLDEQRNVLRRQAATTQREIAGQAALRNEPGFVESIRPVPGTLTEEFQAGLRSGVEGLRSDALFFKGLFNTIVGDESQAAADIRNARALSESASAELKDAESFGDFLDEPTVGGFLSQVTRGVGQILPSAALSIGSAGAGAVTAVAGRGVISLAEKALVKRIVQDSVNRTARNTASPLERQIAQSAYDIMRSYGRTAKTGAIAGAFGAEFAPLSGSNLSEALDSGYQLDEATAARAALVGVPQAAIGTGGEVALLKLIGEQALKRSAVEGGLFANFGKKVLGGGLRGGAIEGTTETAQEGIAVANRANLDPLFTAEEARLRLAESAFVGFFGGAAPGAASGAVGGTLDVARATPEVFNKAREMLKSANEQRVNAEVDKQQFGDVYTGNTTPEPSKDLAAQMNAMMDITSGKQAVWVASDTVNVPEFGFKDYKAKPNKISNLVIERGGAEQVIYSALVPGRGTIFSPNRDVVEEVIASAASDESLQIALGYSAVKKNTKATDSVIQVLDRNGGVVSEEAVADGNEQAALDAARKLMPIGGTIQTLTVEQAMERRKQRYEAEQPKVVMRDMSVEADGEDLFSKFSRETGLDENNPDDFNNDGAAADNATDSRIDGYEDGGLQETEGRRVDVPFRGTGIRARDDNGNFVTYANTKNIRDKYVDTFGEVDWTDPTYASMNESLLKAAIDEQERYPESRVIIQRMDGAEGFKIVRDDAPGNEYLPVTKNDGTTAWLSTGEFLKHHIAVASRVLGNREGKTRLAMNFGQVNQQLERNPVTVVAPDGKSTTVALWHLVNAGRGIASSRRETPGLTKTYDAEGNVVTDQVAAARNGLNTILAELALNGYQVLVKDGDRQISLTKRTVNEAYSSEGSVADRAAGDPRSSPENNPVVRGLYVWQQPVAVDKERNFITFDQLMAPSNLLQSEKEIAVWEGGKPPGKANTWPKPDRVISGTPEVLVLAKEALKQRQEAKNADGSRVDPVFFLERKSTESISKDDGLVGGEVSADTSNVERTRYNEATGEQTGNMAVDEDGMPAKRLLDETGNNSTPSSADAAIGASPSFVAATEAMAQREPLVDLLRSGVDQDKLASARDEVDLARLGATDDFTGLLGSFAHDLIKTFWTGRDTGRSPAIYTYESLKVMTRDQIEALFPQNSASVLEALSKMEGDPSLIGRQIYAVFDPNATTSRGTVMARPRAVIIYRPSGNPLQDALVVSHEIGHTLYLMLRDGALENKALRDRLLAAYRKSSSYEDLKARYGEDIGFEEWFSDQVSLWAAKRYKERSPANMVERFFKQFVANLRKLWSTMNKGLQERLKGGVDQDFETFINEIVELRKKNDTGYPTFVQQAFATEIRDMATASPGAQRLSQRVQAALAGAQGAKHHSVFRPLMKIVRSADSVLRMYGGNEIADMFYVRSNDPEADGKLGFIPQSSQTFDRFLNKFRKEIGEIDSADVIAAMDEAATDTPTDQLPNPKAKAIRKFLEDMHSDYITPSKTKIGFIKNYFPRVLDLANIYAEPDKFIKLVIDADTRAGKPRSRTVIENTVNGLLQLQTKILTNEKIEGDLLDPASKVVDALELTVNLTREELAQAGFLEAPADAFQSYVKSIVKRVEFDRHTKGDANYYTSPTYQGDSKLEMLMSKLTPEDRAQVRQVLDTYMGYREPLTPFWRKLNSWGQFLQFITILPFATIASLTDLAGPMIASREFGGITMGIKEIIASIKNREESKQFARDVGIVVPETVANAWVTESEADFMDPTVRKYSDAYFRVIGLSWFTRFTREFAAGMAVQFLAKHARNEFNNPYSDRYLQEHGVTRKEVLDWLAGGRKLSTPEGVKMRQAVQRFVASSVLRPNSAERPMWGSDPHWALVWQLKGYFYSYGKVMLGGIAREYAARLKSTSVGTPNSRMASVGYLLALTFASTLPFAMLGLELREFAKYGLAAVLPFVDADARYFRTDRMDYPSYAHEIIVNRSGIHGPMGIPMAASAATDYGSSFGAALLGPTAEMIDTALDNGFRVDRTLKDRLLPLYNQL